MSELSELGEWASYYRKQGLSVFPVWGVRSVPEKGVSCLCELGPKCLRAGKHPQVSGWSERDMTGIELEMFWLDHPQANIGIHCKDLFVLDIDGQAGRESFLKFKTSIPFYYDNPVKKTPSVKTGGGGYHLYFKHIPGAQNRVALLPSVDARTEGGYVIAPPSVSAKGSYSWVPGREPWSIHPSELPDYLVELVKPREYPKCTPGKPWEIKDEDVEIIPEGGRNGGMASLCGRLIRAMTGSGSLKVEEIEKKLESEMLRLNSLKCKPPLPVREVETIVWSICRRAKRQKAA